MGRRGDGEMGGQGVLEELRSEEAETGGRVGLFDS